MEESAESLAIERAMKIEDDLIGQYRGMTDTVSLQNLREFLGRFTQGNETVRNELRKLLEHRPEDERDIGEDLVYLHSSEHLELEESVDVSSLRDLLLYISTMERRSLDELEEVKQSLSDPGTLERFGRIIREKEKMKTRADRIYNDIVQGSY